MTEHRHVPSKHYTPAIVMSLLGISRETFRYWRKELDPNPHRSKFNYQLLLAYALVQELVQKCWISPRFLKTTNLNEIFYWFEIEHTESERYNMALALDRSQARCYLIESTHDSPLAIEHSSRVVIPLKALESYVVTQFKS